MLKAFIRLGVKENTPSWEERKLIITNGLSLILFIIVGGAFTAASYWLYNPLLLYSLIGSSFLLLPLLINAMGLSKLARGVMSLVPIALISLLTAKLSTVQSGVDQPVGTLTFSFLIIVALVWDFTHEAGHLVAFLFIASGLFLLLYQFNAWFEFPAAEALDTSILEGGTLFGYMINLLAVLCLAGSLLVLLQQNKISEAKAEAALQQAKEKTTQVEANEKKLQENLIQIKKSQEEERVRQWINEGMTMVTNILRKSADSQEIFDELMSFIVGYTQSNQGAVFTTEQLDEQTVDANGESELFLVLRSTYAYDKKKYLERKIGIGEGLVGQVYLEKEEYFLTEIPENYVNISSGLGDARPRSIFIIPLVNNDEVEGVLELAAFKVYDEQEREFLKNSAEIIASHVRNIRVQERTEKLLKQSQKQAEELKIQEETRLQNEEELWAIQEEMRRNKQYEESGEDDRVRSGRY
ncbi:MAG TPA: hypothetical protein DCE41_20930 [Cytophagales bacterium]|nr:hypothetical protein [Cytophagales bacterium]HAA23546.1 hypothetical protein [Cytophagales bacterium]HAP59556.1 hypothetical protein [Cytophagales bacterium]